MSFAALRRIWTGTAEKNAAARALLVSIGVAAHVGAFGRSFSLRSGCELRPLASTWTWIGTASEAISAPTLDEATELLHACASRAEATGLPVGRRWAREPLVLKPAPNLADAIRRTWPSHE